MLPYCLSRLPSFGHSSFLDTQTILTDSELLLLILASPKSTGNPHSSFLLTYGNLRRWAHRACSDLCSDKKL